MLIPLDMPDANSRISNLRQATADYVAEYNVCKCKPCQNGGTLALLDGGCICLCTHLFEGKACQNFKGDKAKFPGKRVQISQNIHYPFISLLYVHLDTVLQVQDQLLIRKVIGHAGLPGPAVMEGNAPGHADAIRTGSLELRAEATPAVKNTAKLKDDHLRNIISL